MKKVLYLIPVLLLFLAWENLWAQPSGLIPVKIFIFSHDDVYKFKALGVGIEELRDGYIEARVTESKYQELQALGWLVEERAEEKMDPKIISQYHGYNWMSALLDSVHADHPAITKKISYGRSYDNHDLWAFLVTSEPESLRNKAEVRLAANIHGDERVGPEMLFGLIDSLTDFYGSVPGITQLVNTREIWFVPCLNPDGNLAGSRYNGHSEDLNRDFPVPDGGPNEGYQSGTEPETQAFMDYWSSKKVVLSLNYHGGALVANYPWDYTYTLCPDDGVAREVSLGYSRLNPPMYNSAYFDSGVTNGAAWYVVRGSLQDWAYFATSDLDITIECSDIKTPTAGTLPAFWDDNRNSLLFFIRQAGLGIQGIVTDSATGQPLDFVQVNVAGINKAIYSDTIGDYHRMLLSGSYDFTFSKTGYVSRTITGIRVNYDSLTNLDLALAKEPVGVKGNPCEIVCQRMKLMKTYPNPLRASVTIAFQLSEPAWCKLKIYNAAGQLIRTIFDGIKDPGFYNVLWDGANEAGRKTAAGVYYFSLSAGGQSVLGKMVKIH